jgi:hypothetical protein
VAESFVRSCYSVIILRHSPGPSAGNPTSLLHLLLPSIYFSFPPTSPLHPISPSYTSLPHPASFLHPTSLLHPLLPSVLLPPSTAPNPLHPFPSCFSPPSFFYPFPAVPSILFLPLSCFLHPYIFPSSSSLLSPPSSRSSLQPQFPPSPPFYPTFFMFSTLTLSSSILSGIRRIFSRRYSSPLCTFRSLHVQFPPSIHSPFLLIVSSVLLPLLITCRNLSFFFLILTFSHSIYIHIFHPILPRSFLFIY